VQIYYHISESTYNLPQAAALSVVLVSIIAGVLTLLNLFEKALRPGG